MAGSSLRSLLEAASDPCWKQPQIPALITQKNRAARALGGVLPAETTGRACFPTDALPALDASISMAAPPPPPTLAGADEGAAPAAAAAAAFRMPPWTREGVLTSGCGTGPPNAWYKFCFRSIFTRFFALVAAAAASDLAPTADFCCCLCPEEEPGRLLPPSLSPGVEEDVLLRPGLEEEATRATGATTTRCCSLSATASDAVGFGALRADFSCWLLMTAAFRGPALTATASTTGEPKAAAALALTAAGEAVPSAGTPIRPAAAAGEGARTATFAFFPVLTGTASRGAGEGLGALEGGATAPVATPAPADWLRSWSWAALSLWEAAPCGFGDVSCCRAEAASGRPSAFRFLSFFRFSDAGAAVHGSAAATPAGASALRGAAALMVLPPAQQDRQKV